MTKKGHKTSWLVAVPSSFIKIKKFNKRKQKVSAINSRMQYVGWCEHVLANYDKRTALTLSLPICLEPEMKNTKLQYFNGFVCLFRSHQAVLTKDQVQVLFGVRCHHQNSLGATQHIFV